jgi:hypothetical protein
MSAAPRPRDPEFDRAFVAFRYFLGGRGDDLAAPLGASEVGNATLRRLSHPDRQHRAEALASEVGRVVHALQARCFR